MRCSSIRATVSRQAGVCKFPARPASGARRYDGPPELVDVGLDAGNSIVFVAGNHDALRAASRDAQVEIASYLCQGLVAGLD